MTTAALIQRVRQLLQYNLDFYRGPESTDAEIVQTLNDAQNRLGAVSPVFNPSVVLTLTSSRTYDLAAPAVCSHRVKAVVDVVVNGLMLYTRLGTRPGPWSMAELEVNYPSWRTDPAGTPLRWAHTSDRGIVLHPAPDSGTVAAGNSFVSAYVLPLSLSATAPDGVSELPEEIHEQIARMAAAIEAEPVASEQDQFAKIGKWMSDATAMAERLAQGDRAAKAPLGTTSGRSRPDFLKVR